MAAFLTVAKFPVLGRACSRAIDRGDRVNVGEGKEKREERRLRLKRI